MAGGAGVWSPPCNTKLRAYFLRFRYRSSCNRVRLMGVPFIFGIINTSSLSMEKNGKSGGTEGWCSRVVHPAISGR